ncbi:DUF4145 domain-containing protein [Paenibacillus planticolens]|uniref:DUF4145 domain-containing protein n=1 Tax=Paenibacillus planticolens TaxID=2654976 RepID=A0ABX1ZRM6_9BACL|nr:DUF4145 domain-containing protein [Paenibacillus planticolens]NOV02716.1 DUF4145 domain-containing protein [Paenibacillus planticolens]
MRFIEPKNIAKYQDSNKYKIAKSVDFKCGHCSRTVNFLLVWDSYNESSMFTSSRCSGCGEESRFYFVEIKENEQETLTGDLYISPSAELRRIADGVEITEKFSSSMLRAYNSAVNVYNLGEWSGAVVLCRRLLEGITKSLLPESEQNKPLNKQLEVIAGHAELQKPLLTLAHAIRIGGNLGAHFDLEREPDEVVSKYIIDMLDYLIEYLYVLPKRIEELHSHIEELSNKNSER